MNQKNRQSNIGSFWHRLPLRTKLLSPIILVLAAALIIIVFSVQRPVEALVESSVAQGLSVQNDVYHDRLVSSLATYQQRIVDLANSSIVKDFAAALASDDQSRIAQEKVALNIFFRDTLSQNLPYNTLRFVGSNGLVQSLVTVS